MINKWVFLELIISLKKFTFDLLVRTFSDGFEVLSKNLVRFILVLNIKRFVYILFIDCSIWKDKWKTNDTARLDINSTDVINNNNNIANKKHSIFILVYQRSLRKWKRGINKSVKYTNDCVISSIK